MKRIDVAAGLIIRDKRFLAAQRGPDDSAAGLWEFPGGKFEAGEDARSALARELAEEIGILVRALYPLLVTEYEYPDLSVRLHFLHVTNFSGEPKPREGQVLKWLNCEEAINLPFLAADKPLLGAALNLLQE